MYLRSTDVYIYVRDKNFKKRLISSRSTPSDKKEEFLFCIINIYASSKAIQGVSCAGCGGNTLKDICSSTSLVLIFPRNVAAAVRYLPCFGSDAAIMFFESKICWVSSGTVSARKLLETRAVSGANPIKKK